MSFTREWPCSRQSDYALNCKDVEGINHIFFCCLFLPAVSLLVSKLSGRPVPAQIVNPPVLLQLPSPEACLPEKRRHRIPSRLLREKA